MLEFDGDDDFGDLYTDAEAEENRTLTELQEICGASEENETDEEQKQAAAAAEEGQDWNGSGDGVENVSESESEDDLNIVLNDNGEDNLDYNCKVYAAKIGGGVNDEDGNGGEEVDEGNDEVENGGGGGGKFGCHGGGYGAQLKVSCYYQNFCFLLFFFMLLLCWICSGKDKALLLNLGFARKFYWNFK